MTDVVSFTFAGFEFPEIKSPGLLTFHEDEAGIRKARLPQTRQIFNHPKEIYSTPFDVAFPAFSASFPFYSGEASHQHAFDPKDDVPVPPAGPEEDECDPASVPPISLPPILTLEDIQKSSAGSDHQKHLYRPKSPAQGSPLEEILKDPPLPAAESLYQPPMSGPYGQANMQMVSFRISLRAPKLRRLD
jgi:hypothetical protein